MSHRFVAPLSSIGLVAALVTRAGASGADTPPPTTNPQRVSDERSAIEWRWRRFQVWEYAVTATALGSAFYFRFVAPSRDANWTGAILLDDWVRDGVALQGRSNRALAAGFSDIAFYGVMAYRLIDSVVVPGFGWGNWNTVHQMVMIDLESFGFVAITLWGTQMLVARQRPYVQRCGGPSSLPQECGEGDSDANRSFFAGHPAVGMAGAGLTCVHHSHLPLYGGGSGDVIACATVVGAAIMNGLGRVVADKHYASDLAVGYGVGAFAGWILPELLHYRHASPERGALAGTTTRRTTVVRAMFVPSWSEGPGAVLFGIF